MRGRKWGGRVLSMLLLMGFAVVTLGAMVEGVVGLGEYRYGRYLLIERWQGQSQQVSGTGCGFVVDDRVPR